MRLQQIVVSLEEFQADRNVPRAVHAQITHEMYYNRIVTEGNYNRIVLVKAQAYDPFQREISARTRKRPALSPLCWAKYAWDMKARAAASL